MNAEKIKLFFWIRFDFVAAAIFFVWLFELITSVSKRWLNVRNTTPHHITIEKRERSVVSNESILKRRERNRRKENEQHKKERAQTTPSFNVSILVNSCLLTLQYEASDRSQRHHHKNTRMKQTMSNIRKREYSVDDETKITNSMWASWIAQVAYISAFFGDFSTFLLQKMTIHWKRWVDTLQK